MDQELVERLKQQGETERSFMMTVEDPSRKGELLLIFGDDADQEPYSLKPIDELYSKGAVDRSVDPQDPNFLPLFMSIEMAILGYYKQVETLTDAQVEMIIDRFSRNPGLDPGEDMLYGLISKELRLALSFRDYSSQEVKQVFRRIRKSIHFYSERGGFTGYLDFLRDVFSG